MKHSWLLASRPEAGRRKSQSAQQKKKSNAAGSEKVFQLNPIPVRTVLRSKSNSKSHQNSVHVNNKSLLKKQQRRPSHDVLKNLQEKQKQPKRGAEVKQGRAVHSRSQQKRVNLSTLKDPSKSYLLDYLRERKDKPQTPAKQIQSKHVMKIKDKARGQMRFGHRTKQGTLISNPEKTNQDSYLVRQNLSKGRSLYAVADGHGADGHFVSQQIIKNLQVHVRNEIEEGSDQDKLFGRVFNRLQNELEAPVDFNPSFSGSTLVAVLIDEQFRLVCANVGDSRAILARQVDRKNWEIIHLSEDHKPSLEKERKRILKKGGKIHCFKDQNGRSIGPQRVWLPRQNMQGLAMSRSMGDNISKPIGVTHQPQIISLQLQANDKFILIASDGVWEFIKNLQILQLIAPYYREGRLEECCDKLMQLAYDRWTVEDTNVVDDITFILIFL